MKVHPSSLFTAAPHAGPATALRRQEVSVRSRPGKRYACRVHWPAAVACLLLACIVTPPARAINVCTLANGSVIYQDKKCPDGKGQPFALRPDPAARMVRPGPGASSKSVTANGRVIHTGPRGGQYTVGPTGRKNYLPRDKQATTDHEAGPRRHDLRAPPQQPAAAAPTPEVHVGPRGGRYTIGPSGRKNYLPRETAQQDAQNP